MDVRSRIGGALDRLEPPPRAVDWSLFAFVVAEAMTGLVSFTVGVPEGWPLFWLHRALGIGIVALLAWKLARVGRRLTDPSLWRRSTALSVLTLVAALGTLATGIVWVFGLDVRLSYWTLLSVHVGFGLALVPLVAAHAATRFRLPRRVDFERRRTAIRYTVLLAAGAATYRLQQAANDARRHGRLRPEIHRVTAAGGRGERRVPDHLVGRRRPRPDRPRTLPTDGRRTRRRPDRPQRQRPRRGPRDGGPARLHQRLVHGPRVGRDPRRRPPRRGRRGRGRGETPVRIPTASRHTSGSRP